MKVGIMILLAFPAIYLIYHAVSSKKYLIGLLIILLYISLGTVLYKRWQFYTVQNVKLDDKALTLTFLNHRQRILEYKEIERVSHYSASKYKYGLSIYTTSGERIETVGMELKELLKLKAEINHKISQS